MKNRNIKIEYSRDKNPVLKVNNLYVHSKFYPKKEAKKFVLANYSILKDKSVVVVYGLALGYHIKEILLNVSEHCNVYVFDVDTEIYNIGIKLGCYKEIMQDTRVKLNIGIENLNKLSNLRDIKDILVYSPSLKALSNEYENIKLMFQNFVVSRWNIKKLKNTMSLNCTSNIEQTTHTIKDFYKYFIIESESVIVVLSGPSLDYNIKELKYLNGRIKIFCAGSALRTLMKNEIVPDMICITDCSEIVKNQFVGYENLNVPLCFLSTASRWAVSNYKGPKYIFYNDKNKYDDIIINTAKTVSVSLIDIAIKGGAREIILVGQDLAFLNNRTHTESYREIYNKEDKVEENLKSYKKVEGVDGNFLNTRWEYLNFKYSIEKEIIENPQIRFVNCSSGAKIKGTVNCRLSDLFID
ncbi:motility associated factor glycosyltransferase family protein [Clostridium tyrobutyricum]|uniref:motility associated factor glycosyltransferase family protein n=1 Tax=Clostridium tyrobutyricum TaxID=1519 RepID=UPI002B216875|nr:6-hydroxymethylpterin diphosphokinase MptE-like protein [Clostridium tyrobutyricum]MEA5009355.1 6-hydroxymethylpterin diphosphokinase MptE-like protein [Clostridium tyrobutyricum]